MCRLVVRAQRVSLSLMVPYEDEGHRIEFLDENQTTKW
jgi:hypothetical protein